MPYRMVSPKSDRGSIRDIQNKNNDFLEENPNMPPTQGELRIKSLYEHALITRDQSMIDSLGLIVMGGAVNDPIALFRHKQYVKELSDKLAPEIEKAKEELSTCLSKTVSNSIGLTQNVIKQAEVRNIILSNNIKIACTTPRRSFWRTK
jgi:hypothetical protein